MRLIFSLLHQYIFIIPLLVMGLCEITKLFTEKLSTGMWSRRLFQHGGMPSSHSALVTSLLIMVWQRSGLTSTDFAMSVVLASVVWYDAIAARGTIGAQAKVLNVMQEIRELSETVGHSFSEVVVGTIFGALMTLGLLNAFAS